MISTHPRGEAQVRFALQPQHHNGQRGGTWSASSLSPSPTCARSQRERSRAARRSCCGRNERTNIGARGAGDARSTQRLAQTTSRRTPARSRARRRRRPPRTSRADLRSDSIRFRAARGDLAMPTPHCRSPPVVVRRRQPPLLSLGSMNSIGAWCSISPLLRLRSRRRRNAATPHAAGRRAGHEIPVEEFIKPCSRE